MKIQLGPEVISSYKRLAYEPWYALAEFVDNSTQAYFNNRTELDKAFERENTKLTVSITSGSDSDGDYIRIEDNSIGMSERELMDAVCIGKPPLNPSGRSRYGLGLKTGASWFGDWWSIDSKKLNDTVRHRVVVDVPVVSGGKLELPHKATKAPRDEHGTTIEIRNLHRRIAGRTLGKARDFLKSLYRRDLAGKKLILNVMGERLVWDDNYDKRLLKRTNGTRAKKDLKFKVGKKLVTGWAGVLERGSRRDAGFSVIQANRVIEGWPKSYRPETIFGEQEGGINDLVNQRLTGELVLEGFEVSHTKDQILYEDGEKEILENELKKQLKALRQLALSHRKEGDDERLTQVTYAQCTAALSQVENEIKSVTMTALLRRLELPSSSLLKKTNHAVKQVVVNSLKPDIKARVGATDVIAYLANDISPNDPYVIIEIAEDEKSVVVIINLAHPHWGELTGGPSVVNFIRHCIYDGVAESKAYFDTDKLEPPTIKFIKDNLLRVPMMMKSSKSGNND